MRRMPGGLTATATASVTVSVPGSVPGRALLRGRAKQVGSSGPRHVKLRLTSRRKWVWRRCCAVPRVLAQARKTSSGVRMSAVQTCPRSGRSP
jgi:hypothetical protein